MRLKRPSLPKSRIAVTVTQPPTTAIAVTVQGAVGHVSLRICAPIARPAPTMRAAIAGIAPLAETISTGIARMLVTDVSVAPTVAPVRSVTLAVSGVGTCAVTAQIVRIAAIARPVVSPSAPFTHLRSLRGTLPVRVSLSSIIPSVTFPWKSR